MQKRSRILVGDGNLGMIESVIYQLFREKPVGQTFIYTNCLGFRSTSGRIKEYTKLASGASREPIFLSVAKSRIGLHTYSRLLRNQRSS
jgi:hypothetical protein